MKMMIIAITKEVSACAPSFPIIMMRFVVLLMVMMLLILQVMSVVIIFPRLPQGRRGGLVGPS